MKYSIHWVALCLALCSTYEFAGAALPGSCIVTQCNGKNTSLLSYTEKCRCDAECAKYGDCCRDSPYKNTTTVGADCVKFGFPSVGGYYVIRSCYKPTSQLPLRMRKWKSTKKIPFQEKCQSSRDYDEQSKNVLLKLPVTANSGFVYGNQYCAYCNNIYSGYTSWNISVKCNMKTEIMNQSTFASRTLASRPVAPSNSKGYLFNTTTAVWTYFNGSDSTQNCTLSPYVSPSYRMRTLRKCVSNTVGNCPPGASKDYAAKCADYTSIVRDGNTTYKNEYCALCNNLSTNNLTCKRNASFKGVTTTSSTTTAFPSTPVPSSSPTFPLVWTTTSPDKNPGTRNFNVSTREFLHIQVKQNCLDFLESVTIAKLIVETKSSPTTKRTRLLRVVPINDFPTRSCQESTDNENEETTNKASFVLELVVNLGVIFSIAFTLLHLYDFFFTSFASSLTQKTTASYAVAIVMGNAGFLISNLVTDLCYISGAVTYFGFLSSFFWLSALAFDISCKLWCCVPELQVLNKNITNSQKFTAYSLVSWVFPPVATFTMTYVAQKNDDFIVESGIYETCWFQSGETLLLFFVFPLTITMSVNLAFYLFSVYVIYNQRSAVMQLSTQYGIDFKFHTGLIIANNLMWAAALTAMYYESHLLWICFAILNTALGFLVYVSSPVKHQLTNKASAFLEQIFPLNVEKPQS